MGQRLNLEIRKKGRTLANAYYHWSAYTGSAFELVSTACLYIQDHADMPAKLLAIRALEATGAGIDKDCQSDYTYMTKHKLFHDKEFKDCVDRNEGILSVSPESIQDTRDWAEENAYIDMDDPTDPRINFYVCWRQDKEDFIEDNSQEEYDSLYVMPFDPEGDLTLSQCHNFVDNIMSSDGVIYDDVVFREIG